MSAWSNRVEPLSAEAHRAALARALKEADRQLALPPGDPETLRAFMGPSVPVPYELWVLAQDAEESGS